MVRYSQGSYLLMVLYGEIFTQQLSTYSMVRYSHSSYLLMVLYGEIFTQQLST